MTNDQVPMTDTSESGRVIGHWRIDHSLIIGDWTLGIPSSYHHLMNCLPAISRRRFIVTTATALAAPQVLTAQKSERPLVIGESAHRYEVLHNWPQLPDRFSWQTTHNVAIDREGLLYVIHEGRENL